MKTVYIVSAVDSLGEEWGTCRSEHTTEADAKAAFYALFPKVHDTLKRLSKPPEYVSLAIEKAEQDETGEIGVGDFLHIYNMEK